MYPIFEDHVTLIPVLANRLETIVNQKIEIWLLIANSVNAIALLNF